VVEALLALSRAALLMSPQDASRTASIRDSVASLRVTVVALSRAAMLMSPQKGFTAEARRASSGSW